MNKFLTNRFLKYFAFILVVIQGILFALITTFYMNADYVQTVINYPQNSLKITLSNVSNEKNEDTLNFIYETVNNEHLFYVKQDELLNNDGSLQGIILGIVGDYDTNAKFLNHSYLNVSILEKDKIKRLLESKEKDITLGIDITSLKSIGELPKFRFGDKIVVTKLQDLIEKNKTVNGTYRIVGLQKENIDTFLNKLSEVTNLNKDSFLTTGQNKMIDKSTQAKILWFVFLLHSFILLLLFLVITIKSLPSLGKLILQGYSRFYFVKKLYEPYFYVAFVGAFFSILYGVFLTNNTIISLLFFSKMLLAGIINFIIILILLGISSFFVFNITPINAIKNRLPKKLYILLTLFAYIITNVGLVGVGIALKEPYKEIQKNIEIANNWKQVSNEYILDKLAIGDDKSSFQLQSNKLSEDIYHWYQKIEEEQGVSIINTSYFSKELVDKNFDKSDAPKKPVWKFIVSLSYLEKLGINLEPETKKAIRLGERIYLIPDTYTAEEKAHLENWYKVQDTRSIHDEDIPTIFNKERKFQFLTYSSNQEFFTWTTDEKQEIQTKNPIILVLSTNNMIYRETESLFAAGLDSYIKLSKEAAQKYTTPQFLEQFHLVDNKFRYIPISKFIDGAQQNLWLSIIIFFSFIGIIMIMMIAFLIIMMSVFQMAYQEKITIKKFLGYSNIKIYYLPISIISLITLSDFIALFLYEAKIGILCVSVITVLQGFIMLYLFRKNEFKKILYYLKTNE